MTDRAGAPQATTPPAGPADPKTLRDEVDALMDAVAKAARRQVDEWQAWHIPADFQPSADNLAAYLALRHHDLRPLQRRLMALGLSSLGRLESRVIPTLEAVRAALTALAGEPWTPPAGEASFFAGEDRLARRLGQMFGAPEGRRKAALLVTCPTEAADSPDFFRGLARRAVEAVRINCAHDDADVWMRMIEHVRAAERETGHRLRIFMDLAGPKVRTGEVRQLGDNERLLPNDRVAIVLPGKLDGPMPDGLAFAAECTLPELVSAAQSGQRLLINDGAIVTQVETVSEGRLVARVTRCKAGGAKLKAGKGINVPDTDLLIPALTEKDRADLAFVAHHADGIEFSFVQTTEDVIQLRDALARIRPSDWQRLALVLKIERARAVHNLPDILVCAAAHQSVAVMIARGDLAIEIGFPRLAEMQEEILWIGEAAQVPVIWATQVLEQFIKTGLPSRGELTDAAMAVRADCIMLNKGDYVMEAIDALDLLLGRMEEHVHKKTPQLRRLLSW